MRLRVTLVALAVSLAGAAPAEAAFTLANPASAPGSVKAGAHSDVRVHVEPQGGQIRDLDLHLPPGLIGDPNATPRCPVATFEKNACPATTQLGRSGTTAQTILGTQNVNGEIFNVQPRGKEPALLGVLIHPPLGDPIRLESPVTSRPDGGLDSTLRNLPRQVAGLDTTITALDIVLFGRASGKPFMTNPTSCGPAQTTFDAVSYADEKAQAKAAFTPTDCDALPYDPGFSAVLGAPGLMTKGKVAPLVTTVTQTAGEANTRTVAVTLPKDLGVPLDRLARACAADVFAAGQCPDTARIGEATAATPLLASPLAGPVTFVVGKSTVPDLALELRGPLALTLKGANVFTPAGQQTTFDGLPDVPLSRFELSFFGGARGLLAVTRDVCIGKRPKFMATFTSQGGKQVTKTVTATLEGCEPVVSVTLGSLAKRRPSLRLRIDAGSARLRRVVLTLPAGLGLAPGATGNVTGSGAKGSRLALRGRTVTLTVPGAKGARSLGLSLRSGTLRASTRLKATAPFRMQATDVDGGRTTKSVRAER